MEPQAFYLLCTGNTQLAITAGSDDGSVVTLQTFVPGEQSQQWIMQAQVMSTGIQGVAFVNPATGNSITANGTQEPLVMQPFSAGSADYDAWLLFSGNASGSLRIAYPKNTSWSWNDLGGLFKANDQVALWNDTSANSVWTLQLVTS